MWCFSRGSSQHPCLPCFWCDSSHHPCLSPCFSNPSVLGIRQLAAQHGAACPAAAVEVAAACPAADGELQQAGSSEWCLSPCSKAAAAGLRAAAQAAGAAWRDGSHGEASGSSADEQHHLLALPLESNFSGVRYDQRLVTAVQSGSMRWANQSGGSDGDNSSRGNSGSSSSSGSSSQAGSSSSDCRHAQLLPAGRWRVLLDAAKGAATSPPDLSRFPADFVALSYYKAFGWPTGEAVLCSVVPFEVMHTALMPLGRGLNSGCRCREEATFLPRGGLCAWVGARPISGKALPSAGHQELVS